jgi:alkaline phosphatase
METTLRKAVAVFVLLIVFAVSLVAAEQGPQNIILFIGDGMGMNHVQLASVQKALNEKKSPVDTRLVFEGFPVTGYLTTFNVSNLVTDSAAAGTALACGVKTKNGMIGKDATGKNVDSVAVLAKKSGKAVGIVTSVALDDATPSVFYAHAGSRKETDNILEQAFTSTTYDVLMGGGVLCKGWKDDKLAKKSADAGLSYVNALNLAETTPDSVAGKRVFGYFDLNGNRVLNSMDKKQPGDKEPRLCDITRKALEILAGRSAGKGFFLMVEGGAVDKYAHTNSTAGAVTEVMELDKAISDAIQFLKEKDLFDRTLIVVTADHETGGLVLAEKAAVQPVSTGSNIKNKLQDVMAAIMPRASETNILSTTWLTKKHTITWVPLFAVGPESQRFAGRHDNTEICTIMTSLILQSKTGRKEDVVPEVQGNSARNSS